MKKSNKLTGIRPDFGKPYIYSISCFVESLPLADSLSFFYKNRNLFNYTGSPADSIITGRMGKYLLFKCISANVVKAAFEVEFYDE